MKLRLLLVLAACAAGAALPASPGEPSLAAVTNAHPALPLHLRDTGLYATGSAGTPRDGVIPFSPQYPLWSDGARKRRWLYLPPGTAIDASRPDAWEFPRGTRVWKEFSHGGPIETRFIERLADGSWRYATYVWNAEGTDAVLAPAEGTSIARSDVPGGRYVVPSREDCLACHEGSTVPLLGVSALQLSPDRDAAAAHAEPVRTDHADLRTLVARGWIRNLPRPLLDTPPRISAPTPLGRAALGYLHGNCGHCHNDSGALAGLDLALAQQAGDARGSSRRTLESLIGRTGRFRSETAQQRVVPGQAAASVIAMRMRSTSPLARMPPLGVQVIDDEGLALVLRWIEHDLQQPMEPSR